MKNYLLLQVSSILLFTVSATLNILGYINLFPNSIWMAGSVLLGLELAKFTVVGVVYNIGDAISLSIKWLLSGFLIFLIVISVIGHYAMLTSFYTSNQSTALIIDDNKQFITNRMDEIKIEVEELRALYKDFPKSYASKRMKVYNKVKPQIDTLQIEYKTLRQELNTERLNSQDEDVNNTNIFKASADLMNVSADTFALFIILMLSIILDPLALLMVYTAHKVSHFRSSQDEIEVITSEDLERAKLEGHTKALESLQQEEEDIKHNKLINALTDVRSRYIYNTSVKDVMMWDEYEVKKFKEHRLNTKDDRDWFKLALVWKEYGKVEHNEITMDFSKVKNVNLNTVYGKY